MNRLHCLLIVCLLGLIPRFGLAQPVTSSARPSAATDEQRGDYHVVVTVGGGTSLYQNFIRVPAAWQQPESNRRGNAYMVRAMWYPDHRLRTGLETGLTTFYTYRGAVNGEPSSVQVSAIPVLAIFSMPLAWHNGREKRFWERVSLTGGAGAYLIRSRLDYRGSITQSQEISAGWLAAGSYVQPIGRKVGLAAEFRWINASVTKESDYSFQLQLQWWVFAW